MDRSRNLWFPDLHADKKYVGFGSKIVEIDERTLKYNWRKDKLRFCLRPPFQTSLKGFVSWLYFRKKVNSEERKKVDNAIGFTWSNVLDARNRHPEIYSLRKLTGKIQFPHIFLCIQYFLGWPFSFLKLRCLLTNWLSIEEKNNFS